MLSMSRHDSLESTPESDESLVYHDNGVPGVQHDSLESIPKGDESPVHHDNGVPGVEHDEAPLRAGPLGVQGDQQVGCKALPMLNSIHNA